MQLKRFEGSFRSPVVQTLQASINGLASIRAYEAQSDMIREFDSRQDRHSGAWSLFLETGRWLGFRLDLANSIYITLVAMMIPLLAKYSNMSASDIGLSLTTCVQLLGMLQWGIRQSTETENLMTSVERLLEYTKLDEEPKSGSDSKTWPENGDIEFKEVNFSYDGIKDVLKNINLDIKSGEKVGIVGRTGAGKSSLTSCLFRLRELRSGELAVKLSSYLFYIFLGKIMIGNKNISDLNLRTLRRGITVIPQEPMLISESIRYETIDFHR